MKYLVNTVETYRVSSEKEVEAILEAAKQDPKYELAKYNCVYKETKQKGEVVDFWYRLTLTKVFCNEKEPSGNTEIIYGPVVEEKLDVTF